MNTIKSASKICLIGGSARSGTTILKKIFSLHPETICVPEYRFSIDPGGLIDFYQSFSNYQSPFFNDKKVKDLRNFLFQIGTYNKFNRLIAFFFSRYLDFDGSIIRSLIPRYSGIALERFSPNYFKFAKKLIRDLSINSYSGKYAGSYFLEKNIMMGHSSMNQKELADILRTFWISIIEDICLANKSNIFVEDNTFNILYFDKILELLPEAKLVHVTRDPRDVIASYIRMRFTPSDPIKSALFFKNIINQWFKIKNYLDKNTFMEIKLNDLVNQTEKSTKLICDFWGINWHKKLLDTDLSKSNTGRWKKEFTKKQQNIITNLLEYEISKLGYEI